MNFLSTADFSACETPTVLQVIYFGKLILNILRVIIPIGLIIFVMIDFSKCVISGKEDEQKKISKIAFKRIMYAVIIFAVPYIVGFAMSIIEDLVPDYNSCILNATPEKIEEFTLRYEKEQELEEEKRRKEALELVNQKIEEFNFKMEHLINNIFVNVGSKNIVNLYQYDNRWGNYRVCSNDGRTISSSGCGYMSYTMVVRNFGYSDVTPPDIVDIACNEYGYKYSAASIDFLTSNVLNNKFNLKVEIIANESDISDPNYGKKYIPAVKTALKNGKALIILQPGHYISVLGINSDNTIIVRDSARGYESNNKYTVESLYEATKYNKNGKCTDSCGWTSILAYSKK